MCPLLCAPALCSVCFGVCLGVSASVLYGRDNVGISSAAADVAVHGVLDVIVGRPDGLFQERDGGHDLAGRAVTALVPVKLDESGLHRMEVIGMADAFDRNDLIVRMHDGEGEAGVNPAAVDVDGAGSALAVVAAFLGSGQIEVLPKTVEERGAGIDLEMMFLTVDAKRERNGVLRSGRGLLRGR